MPLQVAFVSDVTCPWCAIGLAGLERAIDRLRPQLDVDLRLEPFELNPDLPPGGEDIAGYAARKYGATREQLAERQALIIARGAQAGWRFIPRTRIWNTFDAHRLLLRAAAEGRALALKRALLAAYHERGENIGARDVLLAVAAEAGLDRARSRALLDGDAFAADVRARVHHWQQRGVHAVPSVVLDDRVLLQGGLTADDYERALATIVVELPAGVAADPATPLRVPTRLIAD
jgi:predicted DsbA family dithiol-disulfide isomerase